MPLGEAPFAVLNEVQILNQQRAIARCIPQHSPNRSLVVLPQHPAFGKQWRRAAARAWMNRSTRPFARGAARCDLRHAGEPNDRCIHVLNEKKAVPSAPWRIGIPYAKDGTGVDNKQREQPTSCAVAATPFLSGGKGNRLIATTLGCNRRGGNSGHVGRLHGGARVACARRIVGARTGPQKD
jgi:hypothetical protein